MAALLLRGVRTMGGGAPHLQPHHIGVANEKTALHHVRVRLLSSSQPLSTDRQRVIDLRRKYLSPSLKTFEAYDEPFVMERGEMQYMWDTDGKKYIDLLGQNLCISVGHCHPTVINAAIDQMKKLPHCTTMYYHEQPSELAKSLVEKMPPHPSGEDYVVHLVNDGSEAVDLAVQMARCYTQRQEIISLHRAYHGLHGYAAGCTAIGKATQPSYSAMWSSITHLKPNSIEAVADHLQFSTGGTAAAMILEPLQGYGGIFPLEPGYLKEAFDIVNNAGGVTISDEVQTGFHRTGETFWGFQMYGEGVHPDMVTIAKGLGNGVGIIGAVICRRSIAEAFSHKMFFNTYGCNPVASAAARGVLQVIEEEGIAENCVQQGALFRERLQKACKQYPQALKEVRGSGLFQGLEIAGTNIIESGKNAFEIHRRLREHGVVIGRGSAAGNVFRIQPPMCIEEHDVNFVCDAIEEEAQVWIKEKKL